MLEPLNSNFRITGGKTNTVHRNNKLNACLFKFNNNIYSDGIIGDFKQSSRCGDCYLLSSLYSLSKTTKGAEILKNNIKKEQNGSFSVTLPGALIIKKDYEKEGKKCCITGKYTITRSEIKKARKSGKYSTGDIDVLLYELAFAKYRKEVLETNKLNHQNSQYGTAGQYAGSATYSDPLRGGVGHDAMFILTGKQSMDYEVSASSVDSVDEASIKTIESRKKKLSRKGLEHLLDKKAKNPQRYSITFGLKLKNGNKKETYHALSISKIENNRVYFVNPWNTKKEFSISKEEFLKSAYQISIVDMENPGFMDNLVDNAYNAYGNVVNNLSNLFKKK